MASHHSEMPENHIFLGRQTFKKNEFYFGGLDLQYRTPEIGLPSCEIEKDHFKDSQGKRIQAENKESFESKVLKQKQYCLAVAVAVVLS